MIFLISEGREGAQRLRSHVAERAGAEQRSDRCFVAALRHDHQVIVACDSVRALDGQAEVGRDRSGRLGAIRGLLAIPDALVREVEQEMNVAMAIPSLQWSHGHRGYGAKPFAG